MGDRKTQQSNESWCLLSATNIEKRRTMTTKDYDQKQQQTTKTNNNNEQQQRTTTTTDNDKKTYNKQCNNQLDHDKRQRRQTITKLLFNDNEQ